MSFEAIEKITKTETQAEEIVARARLDARAMIEKADRDGQLLLEAAKTRALQEKEQLFARADQQIAEDKEADVKNAKSEEDTLRMKAAANMDQAVSLIVERIVKA